jgi:hypothetical protein
MKTGNKILFKTLYLVVILKRIFNEYLVIILKYVQRKRILCEVSVPEDLTKFENNSRLSFS